MDCWGQTRIQKSFQLSKWIRTHTKVGKGHVSHGNIAADLAMRTIGDLKNARILMIGTGEVGHQTVKAMHSRGGKNISIEEGIAEAKESLESGEALKKFKLMIDPKTTVAIN